MMQKPIMTNQKKYNLWGLLAVVAVVISIYLIFELGSLNLIGGSSAKIVFVVLVGLSASLLLLLFFKGKIFISWLKYIAWWYLIFTLWVTSLPNNDPWYDNGHYAILLMIILFIITLIYAISVTFVQRRKEKEVSQ